MIVVLLTNMSLREHKRVSGFSASTMEQLSAAHPLEAEHDPTSQVCMTAALLAGSGFQWLPNIAHTPVQVSGAPTLP